MQDTRKDISDRGNQRTISSPEILSDREPLRISSGFSTPPGPERGLRGSARNRKVIKRRVSPFNLLLMLMTGAVGIVLYISNIIAVDQLMADISALEARYQKELMDQELLKAHINRLSSLDRIQNLAEKDLNLKTLRQPPTWLSVDEEKIRNLERTERSEKQ